MHVSIGITCNEPCKVSLDVKEEEGEHPCALNMDQVQTFVLGLKDEMTWSHGDKPNKTIAYLDSGVADIEEKKFVITQEETIFS